jgi:tetratricopeptide (TPR) repeat protein
MGRPTFTTLLILVATAARPQSSSPASPQAGTEAAPADLITLRRQGMDAFRQRDYTRALRILRQVIAGDPSDIVALNVAANSALRLKDYPSAIASFKSALQLQPDEYHNVSGLMRAYTLSGMAPERDELRKHIAELEHSGKLPADFNYVFETFQAGDKKIEVAEFPIIQGFYGERYRSKVFNSAGKQIFCVTLESDALEQATWAKEHPKEAAADGRRFSLDGYASDSHSTYVFYNGEPAYEQVRFGASTDPWRRIDRCWRHMPQDKGGRPFTRPPQSPTALSRFSKRLRIPSVTLGRKSPNRDYNRGNEIDKRDPNPHEGARTCLVCES